MKQLNTNIFIFNADLLCKAKNNDGKWVVGYYTPELSSTTNRVECKIRFNPEVEQDAFGPTTTCVIDTNTLCRCTGVEDINGQFIFSEDYVKHYTTGKENKDTYEIGRVFFDKTIWA